MNNNKSASNTIGDRRIRNNKGETFIAASQRADGSWRKPRKVKDGYIPQDEQPAYQSPGSKASKVSNFPVGWNPIPDNTTSKRKVKQEKDEPEKLIPVSAIYQPNVAITAKQQMEKKLKAFEKKLRDISILEEKISCGSLKNPEKTQLEKITRKGLIEKEIDELSKAIEKL